MTKLRRVSNLNFSKLFFKHILFYLILVFLVILSYKQLILGFNLYAGIEIEQNYLNEIQEDNKPIAFQLTVDKGVVESQEWNEKKINWNDENFMESEALRIGNGERGQAAVLDGFFDKKKIFSIFMEYGYDGVLSDLISVNRSIVDSRPAFCANFKYYKNLPNVSVIITFSNTLLSVLLRTIQSVINRTPRRLLHEIILVDESSNRRKSNIKMI